MVRKTIAAAAASGALILGAFFLFSVLAPEQVNSQTFYPPAALLQPGDITSSHILDGSIVNADVSASAAIVDTKFATITTAGKVSGTALTDLSSVPVGAGVLPAVNVPPASSITTTAVATDTIAVGDVVALRTTGYDSAIRYNNTASNGSQDICVTPYDEQFMLQDKNHIDTVRTYLTRGVGVTGTYRVRVFDGNPASGGVAIASTTIDTSGISTTGAYFDISFEGQAQVGGLASWYIRWDVPDCAGGSVSLSKNNSRMKGYLLESRAGLASLADADSGDSSLYTNVLGLAKTAATPGDTFTVTTFGVITGFQNMAQGKIYYLSNTAGAMSTSAGTNSVKLGLAVSTTTLMLSLRL